jgi:hypothetical protein
MILEYLLPIDHTKAYTKFELMCPIDDTSLEYLPPIDHTNICIHFRMVYSK